MKGRKATQFLNFAPHKGRPLLYQKKKKKRTSIADHLAFFFLIFFCFFRKFFLDTHTEKKFAQAWPTLFSYWGPNFVWKATCWASKSPFLTLARTGLQARRKTQLVPTHVYAHSLITVYMPLLKMAYRRRYQRAWLCVHQSLLIKNRLPTLVASTCPVGGGSLMMPCYQSMLRGPHRRIQLDLSGHSRTPLQKLPVAPL